MALNVAFAAKVLEDNGRRRPKRIRHLGDKVVPVRNPFSGHVLWVWRTDIINIVEGVASIWVIATFSGRRRKLSAKNVELISWLTGNTFLVSRQAITSLNTKETA